MVGLIQFPDALSALHLAKVHIARYQYSIADLGHCRRIVQMPIQIDDQPGVVSLHGGASQTPAQNSGHPSGANVPGDVILKVPFRQAQRP